MNKKRAQRFVLMGFWLRASLLVAQIPFVVSPANQSGTDASAATMQSYSDLNQKLAAITEEPASSCIKNYADYQACKAGDKPKKCKKEPKCTATAVLPPMDLAGIKFNFSAEDGVATLTPFVPDAPKEIKPIQAGPPPELPTGAGVGSIAAAPTGGVQGISAMSGTGLVSPTTATTTPDGTVVRLKPGKRVKATQPVYPPVAKVMLLGGAVVLHAIITKQGTIKEMTVVKSTNPIFDNAAVDAVRQWQYAPYMLKGELVEVDTTVTVNFALNAPNP
jgi:TonB family protein